MVDQLQTFATEVTRVSLEVGTEGKLGGQAVVKNVGGTWKDLTDNVNLMASNLTNQVRDIAMVCKSVARGDLSQKVTVNVQGEILELKNTMNTMVEQLRMFAAEVTRVANEVGTEGKLGGQAVVNNVGGTWQDLTVSVNTMAANLTAQVRDIANVSKAVARGDLTKKVTVNVEGEILDLKVSKQFFLISVDSMSPYRGNHTRSYAPCTIFMHSVINSIGNHQYHGGSVANLRNRSYSCFSRSRYRRQTWRSSSCKRCRRYLEGSNQ